MEITFNLPYVFNPSNSEVDNAHALHSLLDCMVSLNLAYLRRHSAPSLYESGVTYGRTIVWEPIPALFLANKGHSIFKGFWTPDKAIGFGKKRGDCKSLATALIAELINNEIKQGVSPAKAMKVAWPEFRFKKRDDNSGALDFHILVCTKNGRRDPSKDLGMGQDELAKFFK